ncbi:Tellurite resistance protein (telA) [uncultured Gammaproteobacteria bacterium]|jgi:hypothetical protein|nr:Tellurite resistance protein (telA) [Bathymodiolus brooksi thiotrophic gill symbiont]CAC9532367.1 Tellurite resistance protein (telA) [uncultured Gammaproteobacteria bacterium]CAC9550486.1 Tellurite resistance protein (telA) [uncultured Gammaproteobacteria bacterium]CAC9626252.1 Tellurite resistance protein (telA) [uncultured Gammaproteobacteria bacterium]CAC9637115.1 Tellurite resistance protein (telA) [uncultured Gammaproteobacteria bacterium]
MATKSNLFKIGLGFLSVAFLSITYASNWQGASWQSKDYIKKAFFEIAYKNEYRKGASNLRRWKKRIQYKVEYFELPEDFKMAENLIDEHFKDLSDITALPIVKSDHYSNFKIILTKRSYYKEAIEKYTSTTIKNIDTQSNCLLFIKHRHYELFDATVIIPADHAMRYGLLPACIVEELAQAMGLPNDSDWVNPSVANDKSVLDLLTGLDYLMLRILYDKRLRIGMSVKQSIPIVDKILLDFEQQGLIKNAILKARELRLSRRLE